MISVYLQICRFFGLYRIVTAHNQRGQLLIELLLAMGIAAILLPALIGSLVTSRQGEAQYKLRTQGTVLFRETVEAARSVRARDWTTFAVNGTHHPVASGGVWGFESGPETVREFTRQITIDDVYRNSEGAIVESGGVFDPSTKEVEVSVSWGSPIPTTIDDTFYFTRNENMSYTETTEEQFNAGFLDGVAVVNDEGGEVILGSGGSGNWCEPNDAILEELDYPGTAEARAISATEGRVFSGTGANASGLPFANIAISNTNPPTATIIDTFTDVSPPKTNDVFGENDYAYIATDENHGEIIILDLTSTPYSKIGQFNPSGNNGGRAIYVRDNVGYMTTVKRNTFRTFDLSNKSGNRPQLSQVTLAGVGSSIFLRGSYAYVTTSSSSTQLQIIDVGNPANIQIVASLSLTNVHGRDVYVNDTGTLAYVVTASSSSNPEFFIVDISNKSNPSVVSGGTYDTDPMSPTGIRVVPGGRAVIVGEGGGERYQVLNVMNENAPVRCGGLDIDVDIYGIDAVLENDGDAYSYIVTADSNAELKIIEGGPGGGFSDEGVFESATYERPYSTAFNRFDVLFEKPSVTDVTFQIAIAEPESGECIDAEFNFLGPGGDSEAYFTDSATIPFGEYGNYSNPGRCFRYKVFLDTEDSTMTPIFHEMLINHSP